MPLESVPVSMGSPRFTSVDVDGFCLTDARFPADAPLPFHLHERTTFAVMLGGSFDLAFKGKTLACVSDTIFTEPAAERHANYIGSGGAHVLVLQPDPARVELFRPCADMLDRVNHFRDGHIGSLARRLSREVLRPDDVSPLAMEALGLEMLALAARLTVKGPARGRPRWLARAEELIHARYLERLRVDDLARELDIHPVHLTRTFRAHHGVPISEYIRALRLEWAAVRLAIGEDSIASVALRAGFADQSHFTRMFRRHFHTTPACYQRSVEQRTAPPPS